MKRDTMISVALLGVGLVLLVVRLAITGGFGKAYVTTTHKEFVEIERPIADLPDTIHATEKVWVSSKLPEATAPDATRTASSPIQWTSNEIAQVRDYMVAQKANAGQTDVQFSLSRTIGIWLSALLTLFLFSFLYRDNPFYKFAEAIYVGVSAAYWMIVGFWSVIVPNLLGRLVPELIRNTAMPGLEATDASLVYLVPLVLSGMLLWRLMPSGGWVSRWSLAFFIGVFAGLRMIQFIHADFLNQIRNGIMPLIVMVPALDTAGKAVLDAQGHSAMSFDMWASIGNTIKVLGVLACLTYFFFSIEHKGAVGRVARVGTWVLMITFGAMFGYTVMGRITLLTVRLEFLFNDWLWLIDPTGMRLIGGG